MNFSSYIANRYLFSKTSNNAINIITVIASFGVIISSLALFIILSGFSGLRNFSSQLLEISDPDIKIKVAKGKSFVLTDEILENLKKNASIKAYSKTIEERVFLQYNSKNEILFLKGVDSLYNNIIKIDSAITLGNWLDYNYVNTAILGRTIADKLSVGVYNFGDALEIMVPKPGTGFVNAQNAFNKINVQVVGLYSGSEEFENKYVFVTLEQAKQLLNYKDDEISSLELRLVDASNTDKIAIQLQNTLGTTFKVQTKEQLNEVFYKVINTENFVSYLIFTLIIIIALFNVIGAIIMMIIEKKFNLQTLFNLGATVKDIKKIFVYQGFLMCFLGMCLGVGLGVALVLIQKEFELFMITANIPYPVELKLVNVLIVFVTISILGFIAARIASSRIGKLFV